MNPTGTRPGLEIETVETVPPMHHPTSPSMVASPTGSLLATPMVNPEPAYIAAKEAAFIITREVLVEFHQADEADLTQMHDSSLSQISPSSIGMVNAFLDRILLNILSNARSLSLVSLRPAVRDVLRPKLAQEAIAGADEELIECVGEDDEIDLFEDAQESQDTSWDLDLAWKRARLRCMVYTRLGDMEEEDEDRYIDENGLDNFTDGRRLSRNSSMVSPPVAIWLTAILEFIGENVLMVASHAAYKRCESKYWRGATGQALHPSVVLVGDNDLEKIALSPTLGRLWRAWRKPIRSPKTSISRALSIDSMRHRRVDSRSTAGFTRKTSSETLSSLRPENGSKRDSVEKEATASVDPASIPLPTSDYDVDEIEVPGFNPNTRRSRPTSIPTNSITAVTEAFQKLVQGGSRRMRSNSLTMTKWDLIFPDAGHVELGPLVPRKPAGKEDTSDSQRATSRAVSTDGRGTASSRASSELRAPRDMTKEQKRSSSISQRRRSKRLSYQSTSDRKSGVSEYGGPTGPVLFSRSDYRVSQHEAEQVPAVPSDAPPFNTKVTVPTPTVDKAPLSAKTGPHKNRLSASMAKQAATVQPTDDAGYESGEISPLEPSDDEESGQIAGLKDAQEHMGFTPPKVQASAIPSQNEDRPVSMDRTVSPLMEATTDEAPISPVSPEETFHRRGYIDSDFEVSPTEQRRRSVVPPAASTAPSAAPVPAVAPVPIPMAAADVVGSRTSQPSTKRDSDERKRDGLVVSPDVSSSESNKEMPDLPRAAQADMLAAAAAAHANVAVPQPDSLYKSINKKSVPNQVDGPAYPGRPSYEQVPPAPAPAPVTKDIPKSNAPHMPPKPTPQKSNAPEIPPKPAPQKSNAPVMPPKPVPQKSNAPVMPPKPVNEQPKAPAVAHQPDPIITHVTPAPVPQTTTNVTIHRKEVSQDIRPQALPSLTPLQLHNASPLESNPPTSKLLERRQKLPQVDTADPERSGVQRLSPSPPTSANEASKQLPPRSIPETVQAPAGPPSVTTKRKPPSRNLSKSGDEFNNGYGEHTERAKEFNQLINSGETIQYTLTPQHIRSYQTSESESHENLPKPPPSMNRNRSDSGGNGVSNKARSGSRTFAGIPVKIPYGAIRSNSRQATNNKSGKAPREPKVNTESIRELADFMRNTGPAETSQLNGGIHGSASMSDIKPGKRGPHPVRNQDIMAKPAIASMPSGARSPTGSTLRPGSTQSSRRSGNKLVARDPQTTNSGVSDLINFIREDGPAVKHGNIRAAGTASFGGSMNSTQESFKTNSGISSVNSNTGLLANARGSGGFTGGRSDDMIPPRRSRKPRDPYSVDDDDLIEEMDENGGGNEESLADFLKSQAARPDNSHPARTSSNGPNTAPLGAQGANSGKVSSIGRPFVPGGIPSRASLQARGPSGGGSSTQDLADFLKNSGPPPGKISRAPEEDVPKKGGFGLFGGRRQRA